MTSMILILMGVAGAGKSSVGEQLAAQLQWPFYEGDHFHPKSNILKMCKGVPLSDEDREPWLRAIREGIVSCLGRKECAIFSCSALKQRYRDILAVNNEIKFIYLYASTKILQERLQRRSGHFFPLSLLESQRDALEVPVDALAINTEASLQKIVDEIIAVINNIMLVGLKNTSGGAL